MRTIKVSCVVKLPVLEITYNYDNNSYETWVDDVRIFNIKNIEFGDGAMIIGEALLSEGRTLTVLSGISEYKEG